MKFQYDKRNMMFGNAGSIKDPEALELLKFSMSDVNCLQHENIHRTFVHEYKNWIQSSNNNSIKGINNFEHAVISNGTTEAFDKFYMKNHNRRFRCFKGEYMYHRLVWRNHWPTWQFLEEGPLCETDAVVISYPFANTGNKHHRMDSLLATCDELGIPVLLDCAYFGVCSGIDIDLNHDCITDVTFSLSKSFPVAHLRIGMRLTRTDDDDPLFVLNHGGYVNRLSSSVGLDFINKFSPDYIYNKYKNQQLEFCKFLGVIPSQTVLFGLGGDEWMEYERGSDINRLSFHRQLHMDFEEFKKEYVKG
jgi:hypothetical protein